MLSDHEARIKALEAKTIPDFFADIQALEKKHNAILEDHQDQIASLQDRQKLMEDSLSNMVDSDLFD